MWIYNLGVGNSWFGSVQVPNQNQSVLKIMNRGRTEFKNQTEPNRKIPKFGLVRFGSVQIFHFFDFTVLP